MNYLDQAENKPLALALDDLYRQRNWQELKANSLFYASLIRRSGVLPGQHIAILMHNRVEYIEVVLGAILAGVWVTPVNWHLTQDDIRYIIGDSGSKLVFVDSNFYGLVKDNSQVVVQNVDIATGFSRSLDSNKLIKSDDRGGGIMIYTSGTSGKPKGVKRAVPGTLFEVLEGYSQSGIAVGLDGKGSHLVTGPLYHAAPLLYALYDLANGAAIIIMPRWDEALTLRLIDSKKISHSHWVPTMFARTLNYYDNSTSHYDGASLKLVLHGAEPISPSLKQSMIDWWGPVLVEYWGGTEAGVCTMVSAEEWLRKPGTVGRGLPQFEIFALAPSGSKLPAGEVGLLYAKHREHRRVFHYHNAVEKTEQAYLPDGSFTIGDIGFVDSEGYVFLRDRQSNMIISGGVNIYPLEIEQHLMAHSLVNDAVVLGIPNEKWGELVCAVLELAEGYSMSEELIEKLSQHCREKLAAYKVPRRYVSYDRLPRTITGKLYVKKLKEKVLSEWE